MSVIKIKKEKKKKTETKKKFCKLMYVAKIQEQINSSQPSYKVKVTQIYNCEHCNEKMDEK